MIAHKQENKRQSLKVFFGLVIFLLFANLVFADSNSTLTTEWKMFGRTFDNSRFFNGTEIKNLTSATVTSYNTNTISPANPAERIPAVWNGNVYILSRNGTGGGFLFMLNATNISQLIKNITGVTNMLGSVTAADGNLYYPDYSSLYRVNATTLGSAVSRSAVNSVNNAAIVDSSYVWYYYNRYNLGLTSNTNYLSAEFVNSMRNDIYYYSFSNNGVFMNQFNAASVVKLNNYTFIAQCSGNGNSFINMVYWNDYIYIVCANRKYIYQLNATNISVSVNVATNTYNVRGGVSVGNGNIYYTDTNGLTSVSASNVSLETNYRAITSGGWGAPVVTPNYVYVMGGDKLLHQFNASNISVEISNVTLGTNLSYSSPVMIDNYIYVFDNAGILWSVYEAPVVPGGACTCPSPAANWILDMSQNCTVNSCNLAGFNVTLNNTGNLYVNGSFNMSRILNFSTGKTVWMKSIGRINIK